MEENCGTCGSPIAGAGTAGDAFLNHLLDYSDPHHTLDRVPSVELGIGPPGSSEGRSKTDLYIDLTGLRIYVVSMSPDGPAWLPATVPEGVSEAVLSARLSGYVTALEMNTALSGYMSASSASGFARRSDLSSFVTNESLSAALSRYVSSEALGNRGFVTQTSLSDVLSAYVTSSYLQGRLASYPTKTDVANGYASRMDLDQYVKKSEREDILQGRVYRQPVSQGEYPVLDLDVVLSGYLTSEAAAGTYAGKAWVESKGYVTSSALSSTLAGYVTETGMSSVLSRYLTVSDADRRYVLRSSAPQPSETAGHVFRSPTAVGEYPETNLDVILQSYVTSSSADATYASKNWVSSRGYLTSSAVQSMLAGFATVSYVQSALAIYMKTSEADAKYVTPEYLSRNGYLRRGGEQTSGYVFRSDPDSQMNLDLVLRDWPERTVNPQSGKPPSSASVYAELARRDEAIARLGNQVAILSVTGGASCAMNVIEEPEGVAGNPDLIPVLDRACNVIVMSGTWTERVSNVLTVAVPNPVEGVCRDFLVVLYFPPDAGTGQVRMSFSGFRTLEGDRPKMFSYTVSALFSMADVAYGMMVVYALTDVGPGRLAVTRKNLYEV